MSKEGAREQLAKSRGTNTNQAFDLLLRRFPIARIVASPVIPRNGATRSLLFGQEEAVSPAHCQISLDQLGSSLQKSASLILQREGTAKTRASRRTQVRALKCGSGAIAFPSVRHLQAKHVQRERWRQATTPRRLPANVQTPGYG